MRDISIKNYFPHRFAIDPDDETGEVPSIDLRITRFTVEQGKAFNAVWQRVMDPPSARSIFRAPDGDEQEQHSVTLAGRTRDVFRLDDAEIRRRRIQEMTVDARAAFFALEAEEREYEYDVLSSVVTEHVRIAPGQRVRFELDDDAEPIEVITGADLVRVYGGNRAQLIQLGKAVWAENTLSASEKKGWRSLSGSKPSSSARLPAALGPRPVETAGPAEPAVSAAAADVTASTAAIPSGATATSS